MTARTTVASPAGFKIQATRIAGVIQSVLLEDFKQDNKPKRGS